MRGMRERRKEKTGLDMIKPTSFYSSESGKIEKVCISYEPIESYFPNIGDEMINKMTDTISEPNLPDQVDALTDRSQL